jgi:hypothetical protein
LRRFDKVMRRSEDVVRGRDELRGEGWAVPALQE